MDMIIKIQRPLSTNEINPMALLYNKDRSFEHMLPYADLAQYFIDGDLKVYHIATLEGDDFRIGDRVDDQNW
jgi:hypothetical protein